LTYENLVSLVFVFSMVPSLVLSSGLGVALVLPPAPNLGSDIEFVVVL